MAGTAVMTARSVLSVCRRHFEVSLVAEPSERHKALTEVWQAVQREVVPLGGYSPWNSGFTIALDQALNVILELRDKGGESRG